jgi:hypothetical protein
VFVFFLYSEGVGLLRFMKRHEDKGFYLEDTSTKEDVDVLGFTNENKVRSDLEINLTEQPVIFNLFDTHSL